MINFILTVVSANFHFNFRFIFTIQAVVVTLNCFSSHVSQFGDKVFKCNFVLLIGWIRLNVINQESHLVTFILLKHMHCFIELLIVNERTTDLFQEMVT